MIVIDTSIAAKWVLEGESYKGKSLEILTRHSKGIEKITVPDLLFYELANTLATKTELSEKQIKDSLKVIFMANLQITHPSETEIINASLLAKKYKTSVYDMLYAVIAKKNKVILVTADENFIQKTGFKFVKHIKDL